MKDIMIDLETMGTGPTSAIVAIGAVAFDVDGEAPELTWPVPEAGSACFYVNVHLQSSLDAGLRVDGSTVSWWLGQSQDAREALREPEPVMLDDALVRFNLFTWSHPEARIWSHATFDVPILGNAYTAIGAKPPWSYTRARDVRTIYDLAYANEHIPEIPTENKHHALYDAHRQVIGVQACWRKLHSDGIATLMSDGSLVERSL